MKSVDAKPPHSLNGTTVLMGSVGAALLLAGWAYFALPHFGSARFVLDTLAFTAFGIYAFIATFTARRQTVGLEKKLRLALIMRNMELEAKATRDDLTQLFNRRHFFDRLDRELQTAKGSQRPLSVLLIDLDGTKEINAVHGHRTGDRVLAWFGRLLLDQARGSDIPARVGGDEFAIILPDTSEEAARSAVRRLLQAVDKLPPFEDNGIAINPAVSIGASGYPWAAGSADEIIHSANESMQAHKREKRKPMAAAGGSAPGDRAGG